MISKSDLELAAVCIQCIDEWSGPHPRVGIPATTYPFNRVEKDAARELARIYKILLNDHEKSFEYAFKRGVRLGESTRGVTHLTDHDIRRSMDDARASRP